MSNQTEVWSFVPPTADEEMLLAIEESVSKGLCAAKIWEAALGASPMNRSLGTPCKAMESPYTWLDREYMASLGLEDNYRQVCHVGPKTLLRRQ